MGGVVELRIALAANVNASRSKVYDVLRAR
jgi:hypothetical protein